AQAQIRIHQANDDIDVTLDQAVIAIREIRNSETQASAIVRVTDVLTHRPHSLDADDVIDRTESIAQSIGNAVLRMRALEGVGRALAHLGKTDRVLAIAEAASDPHIQVTLLCEAALALAQADETEQALAVAERALATAERVRGLRGGMEALGEVA